MSTKILLLVLATILLIYVLNRNSFMNILKFIKSRKEEAQKTNQYMIRDGVKGVGIDANGNKVFWNCSEDDL